MIQGDLKSDFVGGSGGGRVRNIHTYYQIALMDVEDQRAGFSGITAEDSSLADNRASGAIEGNSIN